MNDLALLLRRSVVERMENLKSTTIRGSLDSMSYLNNCGQYAGLEWVLDEIDQLLKRHPEGVSDLEDFDDDVNTK